jgi:hypothetical protein
MDELIQALSELKINVPSKNSLVAKNGFQAEKAICMQENIKQVLETYFGLPIQCLKRIHGKKSDIIIEFVNGTKKSLQNKDGKGNNRGWSVDRRNVEAFKDESLAILLTTLCLKQGTEKPLVPDTVSKNVVTMCMLGVSEHPDYFTHTVSNKTTGNIYSMSICRTDVLMRVMIEELYKEMEPKRTCVHLSPSCYLQRKGGGKKDGKPNDIQMKFRFTPSMEALFTPLF